MDTALSNDLARDSIFLESSEKNLNCLGEMIFHG